MSTRTLLCAVILVERPSIRIPEVALDIPPPVAKAEEGGGMAEEPAAAALKILARPKMPPEVKSVAARRGRVRSRSH